MADVFSREKRSEIMSRIRSCGTGPERCLGELLRGLFPGEEIAERPRELPGRPDFFLPRLGLAAFMDGCFWHGCPRCLPQAADAERQVEGQAARGDDLDVEDGVGLAEAHDGPLAEPLLDFGDGPLQGGLPFVLLAAGRERPDFVHVRPSRRSFARLSGGKNFLPRGRDSCLRGLAGDALRRAPRAGAAAAMAGKAAREGRVVRARCAEFVPDAPS